MKLVYLESPYAKSTNGDVEKNLRYARACMKDCLTRGEAPFASHLLYTQGGILDDLKPQERRQGMEAGFEWAKMARKSVFYLDLGLSRGMQEGIIAAAKAGREIEFRSLPDWA